MEFGNQLPKKNSQIQSQKTPILHFTLKNPHTNLRIEKFRKKFPIFIWRQKVFLFGNLIPRITILKTASKRISDCGFGIKYGPNA